MVSLTFTVEAMVVLFNYYKENWCTFFINCVYIIKGKGTTVKLFRTFKLVSAIITSRTPKIIGKKI